jgi:hypothetical protein
MSALPKDVTVAGGGTEVTVTYVCPSCGREAVVSGLSRAAWDGYYAYRTLRLHEAFPAASDEEREIILTGMHGECFDREMPDGDAPDPGKQARGTETVGLPEMPGEMPGLPGWQADEEATAEARRMPHGEGVTVSRPLPLEALRMRLRQRLGLPSQPPEYVPALRDQGAPHDPEAILADPQAPEIHRRIAEINIGIRDRGENWSRCANCGDQYQLTEEWGNGTVCSEACDEEYRRYLSDSARV